MGTVELLFIIVSIFVTGISMLSFFYLSSRLEKTGALVRAEVAGDIESLRRAAEDRLSEVEHKLAHAVDTLEHHAAALQRQLLADLQRALEDGGAKSEQALQSVLAQYADRVKTLADTVAAHNREQIEAYGRQLVDRLDHYIRADEQKLADWLRHIQATNETSRKIEMLETALNQYPSSRALFDLLSKELRPLADSNDRKVKKSALERWNRAARVFLDHCALQDWEHAQSVLNLTLKSGNQLLKELEYERNDEVLRGIVALEKALAAVRGKTKLTEAEIEALRAADESIDKARLDKHKNMKTRYEKSAKALVELFHNLNGEQDEAIQAYNLRAVNAFKQAHDAFKADENRMKRGIRIDQLADWLGGWDTRYLTPPAQTYYQAVYADIFSTLDADVKPKFTERVLRSAAKKAV